MSTEDYIILIAMAIMFAAWFVGTLWTRFINWLLR